MCAWVCARKATEEDHDELDRRASTFIKRHKDMIPFDDIEKPNDGYRLWRALENYLDMMVERECYYQDWRYLQRLWERIFGRATRCPGCISIGYGSIGYPSKY